MENTHLYPVVLLPQENGYDVLFPDFSGCVSHGDDLEDAIASGKEALALHIMSFIEFGDALPEPSNIKDIFKYEPDQVVAYITVDLSQFKRKPFTRTIELPAYLDELIDRSDLDISLICREAIKEHLGIKED